MTEISLINFIDLTEQEARDVLRWRNDDTIRVWMYRPERIMWKAHLAFITHLKQCTDKQYFVLKTSDNYLGVIDFTHINLQGLSCDFGLYANPEATAQRIGSQLIIAGIDYAFNVLGLLTLHLEVFSDNERAIKLYKRFSFTISAVKLFKGRELLCFSLNKFK